MKVFLSKYGSLVVSLVFLSLSVFKLISIGTLFDEESGIAGLLMGGFAFWFGDFVSSKLPFKSKSPTDRRPEK